MKDKILTRCRACKEIRYIRPICENCAPIINHYKTECKDGSCETQPTNKDILISLQKIVKRIEILEKELPISNK